MTNQLQPATCFGIYKTSDDRFYAMEMPWTDHVMLEYRGENGKLIQIMLENFAAAESAIQNIRQHGTAFN